MRWRAVLARGRGPLLLPRPPLRIANHSSRLLHAGICTIDLPPYSTYAVLRRAVHTALSMGSVGFDDAAVADDATGGGGGDGGE